MCALGPASASTEEVTTVDIVFDGYCDGLQLNIPSDGISGVLRTVDGMQTGCVAGGVFGQARSGSDGTYGVENGTELLTVPGFATFTVIKRNHTWVHYIDGGGFIAFVNSGTWSLGTPVDVAGGVSSYDADADAVGEGLVPQVVTEEMDISFDGYCDGMHLVAPSAGLGTRGSVDGHLTGCASESLIGAKSVDDSHVVQFVTGGLWVQTVVFSNNTWVHYSIVDNTIYWLNAGTWSGGTPALAAGTSSTA